jgi:hypothetical protein
VESLTESAQGSRRSYGTTAAPFDPKPLIRTFEQAARRLDELSGELEQQENELSTAVRRAEAQHNSNAADLTAKLNQTISSFQKLDNSLNSGRGERWGGNVAVDTGRRLEELDRQRRQALDAHFLIQCWDEVSNRGEVTLLENLRRSGTGEGKIRSASIARQLLRISQRLDPKSHGQVNGAGRRSISIADDAAGARNFNTREIIEKFIETLENDMLKVFDDFYRRQNFEEMKKCAIVLQDFNGGASVQAAFVNQHQFFIDRSNLVTDEIGGDQDTWIRLSDPDADLSGVEPGLQSLVDEVRVVVQEESAIMKRAFPYPEQVLGKFVQRVFQQSIQQRLELVLEKAESESTLAYLRSLQAARSYIGLLVEDLKSHGLTEHPESVTSQTSLLLDQQLDELFTPYFGGSAYIDKEKANLQELYKSLLFKFDLFHSRRQKEPKTYLASLRNRGQELLASAREATDAYVKNLDLEKMSPTQKRILLSVAGLKNAADNTDGTGKSQTTIDLSEEDGRLHIAFTKRMLKWLAEGVRRGLELGGGAETPKDVTALLTLILKTVLSNYVEIALDAASDAASTAETAKREPDLSYLSTLRMAVHITHIVQSCITTLLIPLAGSSLTARREMEKSTRTSIARIEETINTITQLTIDAVLNWTARLLTNQTRTDFRPRADTETISLEQAQTPTCDAVSRFLSTFHDTASSSFEGQNLSIMSLEVAVGVRAQLLDHFKKYHVNRVGGVMLARDMSRYTQLLRSWFSSAATTSTSTSSKTTAAITSTPTPTLTLTADTRSRETDNVAQFITSLEVMTELASVFVLTPDALKERLRGPVLGSVGKEDLRPYLLKRDDYLEVGMQSLLHAL